MGDKSPKEFYSSPKRDYFADINKQRLFTRNKENFINSLDREALDTLGNVSIQSFHLSKGRVLEPHYHQNASEVVYGVSGSAVVSFMNPYTKEMKNYKVKSGQVVNIPQGWWHWEVAQEDKTQLLGIFDAPYADTIYGSDILSKTPAEVIAHTYCLNANLYKKAVAPIKDTVTIGPTDECLKKRGDHQDGTTVEGTGHYQQDTFQQPHHQQNLTGTSHGNTFEQNSYAQAAFPQGDKNQPNNYATQVSFPQGYKNQSNDFVTQAVFPQSENQQQQGHPEYQYAWPFQDPGQQPRMGYPQMNQGGAGVNPALFENPIKTQSGLNYSNTQADQSGPSSPDTGTNHLESSHINTNTNQSALNYTNSSDDHINQLPQKPNRFPQPSNNMNGGPVYYYPNPE